MITNYDKLADTLKYHISGEIDNKLFLDCVSLEANIVEDESNNDFENYEIFLAIIANLHQEAIQTDDFELARYIIMVYQKQYRNMKTITDSSEDEDTMWWLYSTDEYFNASIQIQLKNYGK